MKKQKRFNFYVQDSKEFEKQIDVIKDKFDLTSTSQAIIKSVLISYRFVKIDNVENEKEIKNGKQNKY